MACRDARYGTNSLHSCGQFSSLLFSLLDTFLPNRIYRIMAERNKCWAEFSDFFLNISGISVQLFVSTFSSSHQFFNIFHIHFQTSAFLTSISYHTFIIIISIKHSRRCLVSIVLISIGNLIRLFHHGISTEWTNCLAAILLQRILCIECFAAGLFHIVCLELSLIKHIKWAKWLCVCPHLVHFFFFAILTYIFSVFLFFCKYPPNYLIAAISNLQLYAHPIRMQADLYRLYNIIGVCDRKLRFVVGTHSIGLSNARIVNAVSQVVVKSTEKKKRRRVAWQKRELDYLIRVISMGDRHENCEEGHFLRSCHLRPKLPPFQYWCGF